MSLINDEQRKNAQQQQPTIKPIRTTAADVESNSSESQPKVARAVADLELGTQGTGQEFQLSTDVEQPMPEQPEVTQQQQPQATPFDFSLTGGQQQPQATFVPQDPLKLINNSSSVNIWQTIPNDKSPYAPEILQTLKPTTYDNSRVNSDAAALNARGMAGVASSLDNYTRQQQKNAAAEAAVRERLNSRVENTNIPRKEQPWYAGAAQMFNDVLFGSKQSQEEAERNVINPFKLQYGKQGAGVGGWLKYVLSTPLNATMGVLADWRQAEVNTLMSAGLSQEEARKVVTGEAFVGKETLKKIGLQQDWSKTRYGRSATVDAILRGEQYGDINDPQGNNKGVFYREARPRRTQGEVDKANEGAKGFLGLGGIGQAIADDPLGAGYEIIANILDPVGNKLGDVVAAGIRGVGKAKPVTKAATRAQGVQTPSVFYPPQKPQRLLPPGKVQGKPVEQQLQELFGRNIPQPPRKPGEARLMPARELKLPALPPAEVPPGGFPVPKVNLGDGIPVTGTRVIQPDEGYLPTGGTRKKPTKFVAFPDEAQEFAQAAAAKDPWNAAAESPLQMRATLDNTADLSRPALPAGKFRPENISDPWVADTVEFVDIRFDPSTSAAATQTKAPRIYTGDYRVVQKALPPAIDNVAEVVPEAIVGTPSEVVFRVGIGNPSVDPIQFTDEIKLAGVDDALVDEAVNPVFEAETKELDSLLERGELGEQFTEAELERTRQLADAQAAGVTLEDYLATKANTIQPTVTPKGTTDNLQDPKFEEETKELDSLLERGELGEQFTDAELERTRQLVDAQAAGVTVDELTKSNVTTDLSIPSLRKLGNDWMDYQKQRYGKVATDAYQEDIAPRIADVAGNIEAGKPERSIQALVEFISRDKTYEDVSNKLGIDARKTIDDIWKTLVDSVDPAKAKNATRGLVNKSPEELSNSEKLLLDKVGLSNWTGKQWVSRSVTTQQPPPATVKTPEISKVSNKAEVEFNASPANVDDFTKARRAEAQELLELHRRESADEDLTPAELERMLALEDAQMQGKAVAELTQKSDVLPSNSVVEQEPPANESKVKTWDTNANQPNPSIVWKKHPLASGSVRRVNPQELDKIWRLDRVEAGGVGGIGNRYKDATDFIANAKEPVIMSEIQAYPDGTIAFIDGRHRFSTLRDQGWTEIPVVVRNPRNLPDSVRTITKAADDIPPPVPTEVLQQAAEQLASHKAVIQAPLQQLDDVFETTVDFGRKVTDELPYNKLTSDAIMEAFENNAKLNLPEVAKAVIGRNFGDDIAEALFDADYFSLHESLTQKGIDIQRFVDEVAEVNNALVTPKQPVKTELPKIPKSPSTPEQPAKPELRATIKMPTKVLHGTALADWSPNYSLRVNGSRGELGSGLYVTNRKSVAEDYAKAVISENVSPGANASDIAPAVHELTGTFENTFSARAKLSASDPIVKALVNSLPEQLRESVQKSLYRDKTTTYIGLLNKIEASLVRSGLSPDESVLKSISSRLSDSLRELGYDSVYDTKSGFGLVLDESKISISKSTPVSKAGSPMQAALARYNADAYAAKFYPERLTTDANLRDSAYKLLSQLESTVDDKLQEIQREIINRGLNKQATVLPPKQTFRRGISANDSKPANVAELMDTIEPKSTNPCEF